MTLFGRDSLLTVVDGAARRPRPRARHAADAGPLPGHARSTRAPRRSRAGSCTRCASARRPSLALGGGRVYYGTVDATPLFVMLLGELRRWGVAGATRSTRCCPHADRALEWIDRLRRPRRRRLRRVPAHDRPGPAEPGLEGLLGRRSRFADGTLAASARSRCARCRATSTPRYLARAALRRPRPATTRWRPTLRGPGGRAEAPRSTRTSGSTGAAATSPSASTATSGRSTRCASNMGHCLWTGIVDEDKAAAVARAAAVRRRCSAAGACARWPPTMGGYNPISYHSGSVWPHDNAIVRRRPDALRLRRARRSGSIAALLDAARALRRPAARAVLRLRPRRVRRSRCSYPTSCSPQAWAAASPFLLPAHAAAVRPAGAAGQGWVDPVLPAGVRCRCGSTGWPSGPPASVWR